MTQLAQSVLAFVVSAFVYPLDVFYDLLAQSGMFGIYLAFFLFAAVFRLLITPLIGSRVHGGSSDKASGNHGRRRSTTEEN